MKVLKFFLTEWKILIPVVVVGLLSTGGLIGYWIRSKIDVRQKKREWKQQYSLEDLKKQRELLLEFLGTLKSDFTTLHSVGRTWDEDWRRDKARTVSEWVEKYRPMFPENIQNALTTIAHIAGRMVLSESQEFVQRPEDFDSADKSIETIKSYADEIKRKLTGK